MSKVAVVTQARSTSTRLPGKVLIEVAGRTLLEHHLDRLDAAGLDIIVATTDNAADDPIAAIAERMGLGLHRGSEHDVLSRFAGAIRAYGLDTVIRVTSDCPLIDGDLVRRAVQLYEEQNDPWAYVSNGMRRTYPRGLDLEVFSALALLDADERACAPAEREHVTPFLYANTSGRMRLIDLIRSGDASSFRVTLDTFDDLALIRRLIEDHDARSLNAEDLISVLERHPELVAINAHVEQKKLGH